MTIGGSRISEGRGKWSQGVSFEPRGGHHFSGGTNSSGAAYQKGVMYRGRSLVLAPCWNRGGYGGGARRFRAVAGGSAGRRGSVQGRRGRGGQSGGEGALAPTFPSWICLVHDTLKDDSE